MTHLWCILVPFGVYFTVSGSRCFQCSKAKSRLHTKISTYPIPTASLVTMELFEKPLWGWGSVVNEMTVPPSGVVNLTSDPSSVSSSVVSCS